MSAPKAARRVPGNALSPGYRILVWLLLALTLMSMVVPMLNVIAVAFSTRLGSLQPGISLWPDRWSLDGFVTVWQRASLSRAFYNSSLVSLSATFFQVILCALAGYVLVQRDLPGGRLLASIILFTMMIPGDLTLISIYSLNKRLGLLNSYLGLIVNGLVSGFSILLMRNYFSSIPESLPESGRIDNATEMQILFQIYLPLSVPGLAAITFLEFIGKWNALMLPVTIISEARLYTLPMILRQMAFDTDSTSGVDFIAYNARMAAIIISVLPLIVLYALTQRFLISGLTLGATKG
ncbi:MAG: carbohydrate ABC transporter permease [Christensenellales bacterium]